MVLLQAAGHGSAWRCGGRAIPDGLPEAIGSHPFNLLDLGCRLRGAAKSIDVCKLLHDQAFHPDIEQLELYL